MITVKPWGSELILDKNEDYVVKLIYVLKGNKLSLQYHNIKRETMVMWKGNGKIQIDNEIIDFKHGDVMPIAPKTIHRLIADEEDIVVLETSTPHLDDVVRLEDDYGREGK